MNTLMRAFKCYPEALWESEGLDYIEYDEIPGKMVVSSWMVSLVKALHTDDDGAATALLDEYADHVEQCNSEAYEEYINDLNTAPEGTFPAFSYHPISYELVPLEEIKAMVQTSSAHPHREPSPTTLECIR